MRMWNKIMNVIYFKTEVEKDKWLERNKYEVEDFLVYSCKAKDQIVKDDYAIFYTEKERVINKVDKTKDMVNPDHYKREGQMECIEEMLMLYGVDEVMSFCKLNAHKYRYRAGLKDDPQQEQDKAAWYMNKYKKLKETKEEQSKLRCNGFTISPTS